MIEYIYEGGYTERGRKRGIWEEKRVQVGRDRDDRRKIIRTHTHS